MITKSEMRSIENTARTIYILALAISIAALAVFGTKVFNLNKAFYVVLFMSYPIMEKWVWGNKRVDEKHEF